MDAPPPPSEAPPPRSETRSSSAAPIAGFVLGAVAWATTATFKTEAGIVWLLFVCFVLPVIAAVLAIIRSTRRFGLGLLLACGLGWLVLGAICGGLFDPKKPDRLPPRVNQNLHSAPPNTPAPSAG